LIQVLHIDVVAVIAALLGEPPDEAGVWLEFSAVEIWVASKLARLYGSVEGIVAGSLARAFCGAALAAL
jgi:hypothetical protein